MTTFNVKVDEAAIKDALAALSNIENGFVRAYARALNSTATATQQDMITMARDDYRYKVAAVKRRTMVNRATWSNLQSSVKSTGGAVNLSDFLGTRQTKEGLTVNVKASTGLQRLKHGFLAPGRKSGKLLAFWRAKPADDLGPRQSVTLKSVVASGQVSKETGLVWRRPAVELFGPHPEVVYNTPENWEKLSRKADLHMKTAFAAEVDGVLRQYG